VIVYAQDVTTWGNCVVDGVPTLKCFEVVFNNLLTMSSALVILALFIMVTVAGFQYLTAFGNPEKIKKAQGTIRYAIIGFVLFLSAYLIITVIGTLFLGDPQKLLHFEIPSQ